MCGKSTNIEYDIDGYKAWKEGALIQDAFPDMSADDRETLISGLDPECFASLGE
jgi:hypothetical protein